MKESDDIANLFRHFGGQPGQYQEISRDNEARQSRGRWPLLSSIEADQAARFPPVDAPGPVPAPAAEAAPEPAFQPAPQPAPRPVFQPSAPPATAQAGRIEPRLSTPAPAPSPEPKPEPEPAAPARSEFILPRAGALSDKARVPAPRAAAPAASPVEPEPPARPEPAAARREPPPEPAAELHAIFSRLARPASRPAAGKGNASLLERLNRL